MTDWLTEPAALPAEDYQDTIMFDLKEVFSLVRTAGRRIIDKANENIFYGPVQECLAPDPFPPNTRSISHCPIIGVVGSDTHEYAHLCEPLGQWIASQGYHLLTFNDTGVSHAVSRAFALSRDRIGCSLALEPLMQGNQDRITNEYVEIPLRLVVGSVECSANAPKSLFYSTAHAVIVLPGVRDCHLPSGPASNVVVWEEQNEPIRATNAKQLPRVRKLTDASAFVQRVIARAPPEPVVSSPDVSIEEFEMLESDD